MHCNSGRHDCRIGSRKIIQDNKSSRDVQILLEAAKTSVCNPALRVRKRLAAASSARQPPYLPSLPHRSLNPLESSFAWSDRTFLTLHAARAILIAFDSKSLPSIAAKMKPVVSALNAWSW